ncbi:MAG TPA: PEGA domain-containing protein, partial [Polyangiales bacterium]
LGMVEFELRNYVDAVTYLEGALDASVKRLEGEMRSKTESLLERARAYVGSVRLEVAPTEAEVLVDGFPVPAHARANLRLSVGDHVFEFRAAGYADQRRAIKLRGEQTLTLKVELARASAGPVASGADRPQDVPATAPTPVYRRWWLWTTLGVVVAGGVVAAVLLKRETEQHEEPVLTANTPPNATIFPLGSR